MELETVEAEVVELVGEEVSDRPFFTTDFSDYTVTEGLLLCLVLLTVLQMLIRIVKEGFWWLLP